MLATNIVRYQMLSRTRTGRRYLQWWCERSRRQILRRYFGDATHDVGELRVWAKVRPALDRSSLC
ncbi:MAG TPA: hypothetical protein VEF72_05030 [Mycobacterium sp.]|nr:hypothetical protein [Mycobacterium sp.]